MASVGSLAMTLLVVTLASHVAPSDLLMPGVRSMPRKDIPIFFPDPPQFEFDPARPRPHGHLTPISQPLPIPGDEDLDLLPVDIDELAQSDLHRLNSFTNISEFISFFNLELPMEEEFSTLLGGLTTRFGGAAATVDNIELAEMANCKPELVTVPLDLPVEGNTIYFPTCVRLEQCGGCCFGPRLICRPTVTKVVTFKVLKTVTGGDTNTNRGSRRGGGSERRRRRRRRRATASYHEVEAIKHTACTCGCRVQESDCNNRIHNYFEGECACVCKNRDEKRKCEEQNSTRYWDNNSCSCYCHKTQNCSTGQIFSQQTCRCETLSERSGLTLPGPPEEDLIHDHLLPDLLHRPLLPDLPHRPLLPDLPHRPLLPPDGPFHPMLPDLSHRPQFAPGLPLPQLFPDLPHRPFLPDVLLRVTPFTLRRRKPVRVPLT